MLRSAGLVAILSCAACSTGHVLPEIDAFGQAVTAAAGAGERLFPPGQTAEGVAALRRQQIAAAGGVLVVEDGPGGLCGLPVSPGSLDPALPPPRFDDICRLRAAVAADADATFEPRLPDTDPAVVARSALTLLAALGDYAEALAALARSDAPQSTATALGGALGALAALGSAAQAGIGGTAPSPATAAIVSAGNGVLSATTREALEARRHALLREVVRAADPAVADAAQTLAVAAARTDAAARDRLYAALLATADDASPGDAAAMAAVEAAAARTRAAEDSAAWRPFFQIAAAHRAIRDSLDAPADFARLAEANARIAALAGSVRALVTAVEDGRR